MAKTKFRRIAIVSKSRAACALCRKAAERYGFLYDEKRPDVVLTYGGDGTLLHAERLYPGLPKLPLRNSATSQKSHDHPLEHALARLATGAYSEERQPKLEAVVRRGKERIRLLALNDIILRNSNLARALRFSVAVDGKLLFPELIGDGVVVATPFGSTAYFRSVTRETFTRGIGLAFNNLFGREQAPMLLGEACSVTVKILRGPGEAAADNLRVRGTLLEGDSLTVRRAKRDALLLSLR